MWRSIYLSCSQEKTKVFNKSKIDLYARNAMTSQMPLSFSFNFCINGVFWLYFGRGWERKNTSRKLKDVVSSLTRGYERSGVHGHYKWLTLDCHEKQSHSTFGFTWLSSPTPPYPPPKGTVTKTVQHLYKGKMSN